MNISQVELPSNRKFGVFFTAIFLAASIYLRLKGIEGAFLGLAGLSAAFLIVTLIKPDLLRPLNALWMRLGLLLGMIVSPVVLGVIFFGMFTPLALFLKLIGRDELRLRPGRGPSYWVVRDAEMQSGSFKDQF